MEFKFPHTPHLAWLGAGAPRADKVMTPEEMREMLKRSVVVEEKVDGANVGIAFPDGGAVQVKNRGTVLGPGSHEQFQQLWPWISKHRESLRARLGDRLVLFGEWSFAVHTVHYRDLPEYFLAIDVYDTQSRRFWNSARRDALAEGLGITPVPVVARGKFSLAELERLLEPLRSKFGGELVEGIYVRQDGPEWLEARAKLVRPQFLQATAEHWTRKTLTKNRLAEARG